MMEVSYWAIKIINEKAKVSGGDKQEVKKKVDEFFETYDYNNDNKISRDEFRSYIKTDSQIVKLLLSHQATSKEDLGNNFGSSADPLYDEDLDAELNPPNIRTSK